jgi:hypothetical protein
VIKIKCRTLFDITATGITGHLKTSRMPFKDRAGNDIVNEESWNRSRNQQRNWETLTQIVSLRTQIIEVTDPVREDNVWIFEFASETPSIFGSDDDPVSVLREDAHGVPMLNELGNTNDIDPMLITFGNNQNIWFDMLTVNT